MLLSTVVTLQALFLDTHRRATERLESERGSITLEQAVIASALFIAAVALLAVIVRAIQNRADTIS
jgi:hypothetical protein